MTYAPDDLRAVQRYAQAKTGQDWASLGIVGDTSHNSSGGYHVGHDVLHALGTAPEDPGSDYSYTESQRDRNGLTDAASAFDMGGNFPRFYEFNAWVVGRARVGDPRCRDIREIIHTLDGRTVRRWDALGVRSNGDSSHLTHTHFSFFRDSEGRRASSDNVLGLLTEFFDGAPSTGGQAVDVTPFPLRADGDFDWLMNRLEGMAHMRDAIAGGKGKGDPIELVTTLQRIDANAAAAAVTKAAPVTMTDADRTAIADLVVAKLAPTLPTAAQVADELAKRLGNG